MRNKCNKYVIKWKAGGANLTRQGRRKAGVILSLCACLTAGQVVLATGNTTKDETNTLYVGGAAAVFADYNSSENTNTGNRYSVQIPIPQAETSATETGSTKTLIAGVAEVISRKSETQTEAPAETQTEAVTQAASEGVADETAAAPETAAATEETAAVAESKADTERAQRQAAIEGFSNMGIAVVGYSYLNVREEPSTDGKIVAKMMNNYACDILETVADGAWYKIQSGSITGYVSAEFILTGEEAKERGLEAAEKRVIINSETVNVRTEPSIESAIWTQVNNHERYDVIQELDGWTEIELDSSTGFVSAEFTEVRYTLNRAIAFTPEEKAVQEENSLRSQIVNYAMQYLGNRYVWGGESLTNGVDCSGFTMKVYERFGIYMSHYTGSQAVEGRKISQSEMKKGDLIFYAKNGTINHVSIYIGNGQAIHARSAKRGITITDWDYRTPVKIVSFLDD